MQSETELQSLFRLKLNGFSGWRRLKFPVLLTREMIYEVFSKGGTDRWYYWSKCSSDWFWVWSRTVPPNKFLIVSLERRPLQRYMKPLNLFISIVSFSPNCSYVKFYKCSETVTNKGFDGWGESPRLPLKALDFKTCCIRRNFINLTISVFLLIRQTLHMKMFFFLHVKMYLLVPMLLLYICL